MAYSLAGKQLQIGKTYIVRDNSGIATKYKLTAIDVSSATFDTGVKHPTAKGNITFKMSCYSDTIEPLELAPYPRVRVGDCVYTSAVGNSGKRVRAEIVHVYYSIWGEHYLTLKVPNEDFDTALLCDWSNLEWNECLVSVDDTSYENGDPVYDFYSSSTHWFDWELDLLGISRHQLTLAHI